MRWIDSMKRRHRRTVDPEAVVTVATVDKKGVVIRKPNIGEAGPESVPPIPTSPERRRWPR